MINYILFFFSFLILIQSCSYLPELPSSDAYVYDIKQGSILSSENINKLKKGMTKEQVLGVIGPPAIVDPFHNNEWLYINHSFFKDNTKVSYKLLLTFNKEVLVSIVKPDIDILPKNIIETKIKK